jgi:glyoxylase-like metal-dependent hydrolase (beta-lactamase superfamily II)/rhodanese-related sulfurtransferase
MDTEITVPDLLRALDRGEPSFLLDVRNEEEFASWRFEGKRAVETINIPYFEFIEDPEAALARVPHPTTEISVVCAKGGSSEFVAELLRESGIPARNVAGGMRAYGSYLEPAQVTNGSPEIWQLNRRGKGCLSYVIRSGNEAIVVDPSRHTQTYVDFVAGLNARITRVLDTHVHADHVSGGPALAQQLGIPYFATAGPGIAMEQKITPLSDGDTLSLGDIQPALRVLATPGHTPGSICYLVAGTYLLSGDTLFVNGIGRPDLGGEVEAWARNLFTTLTQCIATLPEHVIVLPAHYSSVSEIGPEGIVSVRLGDLKAKAAELRMRSEEAFVNTMVAAVQKPPAAYSDIIRVNLGLAQTEDEQATEWELGKNECAAARH